MVEKIAASPDAFSAQGGLSTCETHHLAAQHRCQWRRWVLLNLPQLRIRARRWLSPSQGLIVIVLIIWPRRGTLVLTARVTILRWSVLGLGLGREKYIIAWLAQP
jgi:hypothetical protein